MVVYGANGSGKSSFVDAVEYILNDGRIGHLANEYSGKHQEKAVRNTHTPQDRSAELKITFADDSELATEITESGSAPGLAERQDEMRAWDYRRTVLRQGEVASFVRDTKGNKYFALLPLLGLGQLEMAAENLRQLAKAINEQPGLGESKSALKQVAVKRQAVFGAASDQQIADKIEDLHGKYCPEKATTKDPLTCCLELGTALNARISTSSDAERLYIALRDAAAVDVKSRINAVRATTAKFAAQAEPLIAEKVDVLEQTDVFVHGLSDQKEVECPACGRLISVGAFREHVKAERERLNEAIESLNARKASIEALWDAAKSVRETLRKPDAKPWRDQETQSALAAHLSYLDALDADALRLSCDEDGLTRLEAEVLPVIAAAALASKNAPPDALQLSTDKESVETARAAIAAGEQLTSVQHAETLASFVKSLEQGVREEIKLRAKAAISDISADMCKMWNIVHPAKAIEGLQLYVPKDADKAIEIGLRFHGVEQKSPTLTLSEGYGNSLGLCIFLAMAKREASTDRPLFLDDVVVSLDRNHRGLIAELLEREFKDRQVVILTHDREWYTELRQQLDDKRWSFKALLPYETPDVGIRWSHKASTWDDARAQLTARPDSAGNDARKIMDVELALAAERLQILLPYVRGDRNDKRMAHDFLERLVADGTKCFQKKTDGGYAPYTAAGDSFREADHLLVSWGNRASHTFDLVRPEAEKLLAACEKARESFRCPACQKEVWFADAVGSEWVQCQCGQIRWRYGKA
jgi:energy-coupling factor transporter ATP-binding protein EcfA2